MLRLPINPNNADQWNTSIKYAVLSAFIVVSVAALALFEKYIWGMHLTPVGTTYSIFPYGGLSCHLVRV
jgi:hypothetical protein